MMAPPAPALAQSKTISSTASRAAQITAQSGASGSPHIRITNPPVDRFIPRIHRIGSAGVVRHVGEHLPAEGAGAGRRTDDGDAGRVEQPDKLVPAVHAGAPVWIFIDSA